MMFIKRGDILIDVDFSGGVGREQDGVRPCIVVSNKRCNRYSPVITVIPITTSETKTDLPTHLVLDDEKYKLKKPSIVLAEQITTIDKSRIGAKHIKSIDAEDMKIIDGLLKIQLELLEEEE